MLIESYFRSDRERREIFPVEMAGFPCICRRSELRKHRRRTIPWHWHNAFEITYVDEGALVYRTPEQTVTILKGEALFTNSGVLHTCTAADSPTGASRSATPRSASLRSARAAR